MNKQMLQKGHVDWRALALCLAAGILTAALVRAVLPEGRSVDIHQDDDDLRLSLPGILNAPYDIQVRRSLTNAWEPLGTVTGQAGETFYPVAPDGANSRFFRVLFPQPTVTAGEPAFVPEAGGTTVHVTGQYFYTGDQIFVDGVLLSNVTFISSTLLRGTLPNLSPGLHKVEVVSGHGGLVLATLSDALEVAPPLARTLQGPPEWPPAGPASALPRHHGHVTVLKQQADGHVTVLKQQADGHVTVLKQQADGHVTVLKSHGDENADGILDGYGLPNLSLHAGEVEQQVVDLAVPGRGLDFLWTRTYRSRTGAATAQGNRWSHSYDVRCVQGSGAIDLYDGTGRKDTFRLQADGSYTCPEFFREGTLLGGVFRLTFADTGYWEFNPFGTSPAAGRLAHIVDRHGNTMSLAYDVSGRLVDDRGRPWPRLLRRL